MDLVAADASGLFVPAGPFHVDPSASVARAIVTHPQQAAAVDFRGECVCTDAAAPLVRQRWPDATVRPLAYRERLTVGRSVVSLHPSGHALGAAQIRVETDTGVAVITGAYKRSPDPTCAPFEAVATDTLVIDATFALPIFRWPDPAAVVADLHAWWEAGRHAGRTSLLLVDAAATAARILAMLARRGAGPIHIDPELAPVLEVYRAAGVLLPESATAPATRAKRVRGGVLVIAPRAASPRAGTRRFPGGGHGARLRPRPAARRAAPPGRGSGLRDLRPRRLGTDPADGGRAPGRARTHHGRPGPRARALPPRAGTRRTRPGGRMKAFAALYDALDRTTSTNAKVAAIAEYFRAAPPGDAAWALFFLTGRKINRLLPSATLHELALEITGLPNGSSRSRTRPWVTSRRH